MLCSFVLTNLWWGCDHAVSHKPSLYIMWKNHFAVYFRRTAMVKTVVPVIIPSATTICVHRYDRLGAATWPYGWGGCRNEGVYWCWFDCQVGGFDADVGTAAWPTENGLFCVCGAITTDFCPFPNQPATKPKKKCFAEMWWQLDRLLSSDMRTPIHLFTHSPGRDQPLQMLPRSLYWWGLSFLETQFVDLCPTFWLSDGSKTIQHSSQSPPVSRFLSKPRPVRQQLAVTQDLERCCSLHSISKSQRQPPKKGLIRHYSTPFLYLL